MERTSVNIFQNKKVGVKHQILAVFPFGLKND